MNRRNGANAVEKETNKKPVEVGQKYFVHIEGINHEGEGVARINGFAVFIDKAAIGDKLEVEITAVKKNFALGKISKIIEPSADRVNPFCTAYGACGGCQLQHLNYAAQLKVKKNLVIDAVERVGKLANVKVHDTLGMADPMYYRNKVQLPVGKAADKVIMGFYAPASHQIVDLNECFIQHESGNRILQLIKQLIAEYKISVYNEKTGKGLLRHVLIRIGTCTGEVMVVFVTNGQDFPQALQIADVITAKYPEIVSVIQNINNQRTNVILGKESKVIKGKNHITECLGDLRFKISPLSFFQVNTQQAYLLYQKALAYADLTGNEIVIDAYCGTGTISLFLTQQAQKVYGIEVVADAINDAKENARLNGINNVEFIVGKTEDVLPRIVNEVGHVDVAVVDPPRKGCEASVFDTFAKLNVQRIVYISCNPSSLARDLAYLQTLGYETLEVQPVDLFPHTVHVEMVVLRTIKL